MLVYRFNVLDALKDNGYNTARLRQEKLLGENAIHAIRHNKMVGINALDKICCLLDTQPGTIIKYVSDTPGQAGQGTLG